MVAGVASGPEIANEHGEQAPDASSVTEPSLPFVAVDRTWQSRRIAKRRRMQT